MFRGGSAVRARYGSACLANISVQVVFRVGSRRFGLVVLPLLSEEAADLPCLPILLGIVEK
jgi:hypothetical protein